LTEIKEAQTAEQTANEILQQYNQSQEKIKKIKQNHQKLFERVQRLIRYLPTRLTPAEVCLYLYFYEFIYLFILLFNIIF